MLLLSTIAAAADFACDDARGTVDLTADLTATLATEPAITFLAPARFDGSACALTAAAEATVWADLLAPDPALSLDRVWVGITGSARLQIGRISSPSSHWLRDARQGQRAAVAVSRPLYADERTGLLLTHGDGVILERPTGRLDLAVLLSANEDGGALAPRTAQIVSEDTVFPVHNVLDEDSSLEGAERLRLDAAMGLRWPTAHLGLGGHIHRLAEDAALIAEGWSAEHTRAVLTGHLWWEHRQIAFRSEVVSAWTHGTQTTTTSRAAIAQAAWQIPPLAPYLRLEGVWIPLDAYYTPMSRDLDRQQGLLGLRWGARENLAIKLEGIIGQAEQRDALGQTQTAPVRAVRLQLNGQQ